VLVAPKVHETIATLVSATAMATGDDAAIVATFVTVFGFRQGFLGPIAGDFGEVRDGMLSGGWGVRSIRTDAHRIEAAVNYSGRSAGGKEVPRRD
jgi:hypothetical protein